MAPQLNSSGLDPKNACLKAQLLGRILVRCRTPRSEWHSTHVQIAGNQSRVSLQHVLTVVVRWLRGLRARRRVARFAHIAEVIKSARFVDFKDSGRSSHVLCCSSCSLFRASYITSTWSRFRIVPAAVAASSVCRTLEHLTKRSSQPPYRRPSSNDNSKATVPLRRVSEPPARSVSV
jgi:hypothetical protein